MQRDAERRAPGGPSRDERGDPHSDSNANANADRSRGPLSGALPALSLPKGGGAIRGIGEKASTNAGTGTFSVSIPVAAPPGRNGSTLNLSIGYTSGAGNGPFGLGWHCSVAAIARKTDRGLPLYDDGAESDTFTLAGSEDLVPVRSLEIPSRDGYRIQRYEPRIEGGFARIERWTERASGASHWRVTTRQNVLSIYGRSANARLADPEAPEHKVFSWLLEEMRDDRGNVVRFSYKQEDGAGIHPTRASESNRFELAGDGQPRFSATAQRYLKRIQYANRTPIGRQEPAPTEPEAWHFEVVFDYGEHDALSPTPDDAAPWRLRQDAFSSHRAGFEVRTYRLCHRILVFHRFPELGDAACLVRSTDFTYEDNPSATYLVAAQEAGYVRDGASGSYFREPLPTLRLDYVRLGALDDTVRVLDAESLEGLPAGVDGATARWVDLDGEGIQGVLSSHERGWYYKSNLGDGRLAPPALLRSLPVPAELGSGLQQLVDIDGNGQLELLCFRPELPGMFSRTRDGDWQPFRPFSLLPNLAWKDPNLRFVDVDGDGLPDLLVSEEDAFVWYRSLADGGYAAAERERKPWDEEKGARVVFADGSETIHLADMSGDGLVDIVRVRNGEVCYWPNQGRGRFGRKVVLEGSPVFAHPDDFDPKRVQFGDIDGSGTADIIYLAADRIDIYLNQSGNALAERRTISTLPPSNACASTTVFDLLGTGTACLVWSTTERSDSGRRVLYVNLTRGEKPHLLKTMTNGLGAETHVEYAPSTRFYLADKAKGEPWVTRLPFPVRVVERVTTFDRIGRNRFVTRYVYHHGYFDGVEREFRGFGRVEQFDTEELGALTASGAFPVGDNVDATSYVPPVLTKTWFHTGAFSESELISRRLGREYFREPGLSDSAASALELADTVLPEALGPSDAREACRALKGSILRQETYALDGSAAEASPYKVSERSYGVVCVRPRGAEAHGVYFIHPREVVEFLYERKLYAADETPRADPRVSHVLSLAIDAYGTELRSVTAAYGRRQDAADGILTTDDEARQRRTWIRWSETSVTNTVESDDAFRAPVPYETRTFEITKLAPASTLPGVTNLFRFEDVASAVQNLLDGTHDLPSEDVAGAGATAESPYRRLVGHQRTLFRRDDLAGPLPLGQLQSLGLIHDAYRLTLTPGLVNALYGSRVTEGMLLGEGGFVHSEGDSNYWAPTGRTFFSPNTGDSPVQELAHARSHFFLPYRFANAFDEQSSVVYDAYDLLVLQTEDALGNKVTAGERNAAGAIVENANDYRVLGAAKMMDANRNRGAVAFDAVGAVVGTAVMGKPEEHLGDSLDGFAPDLPASVVAAHLANPLVSPEAILGRASTRVVYDRLAYERTASEPAPQPATLSTLRRVTHDAELVAGAETRVEHGFEYSDGFGRIIQQKVQAEPGPLAPGGLDVAPRWIGTGWTIFDNKGNAVRRYEPFFTATHRAELGSVHGVSSIAFYDPVGRAVATLHPNHSYEKVVWDPWQQASWDVNDTVLLADPKLDADAGDFFRRLPDAEYLPTWYGARRSGALGSLEQAAAQKAEVHAETPATTYFDALGRTILGVRHNRFATSSGTVEEQHAARSTFDEAGRVLALEDALGRVVVRYAYDLTGTRAYQASMEAGERRALNDVTNAPIRAWDSRGHVTRIEYDELRRVVRTFVQGADPDDPTRELLCERTEYGEGQPDNVALNLRTRPLRRYDGAGVITFVAGESPVGYDFKGNPLRIARQLASNYRTEIDWAAAVPLDAETFHTATHYDALNRPTELVLPDGSVVSTSYNEAGLLERIEARVRGSTETTTFVEDVDYDAKGQRASIRYGNGAVTTHTYDPRTFRLARLVTTRAGGADTLVDNAYTYDAAGNVTHVADTAQQAIYFANAIVEPAWEYTYDALYRLIEATGREHLGMGGAPEPTSETDAPRVGLPHPNDRRALGLYRESYEYDAAGNLLVLAHRGTAPAQPGWTRTYEYDEPSQLEATQSSNRLSGTTTGATTAAYTYDAHGNTLAMPHLPLMQWDYKDQLKVTSKQVVNNGGNPEKTYYVQDSTGQRVRKVTERQAEPGVTPTRMKERLYLGGLEIYREYDGDGVTPSLERQSLALSDGEKALALVETRTRGDDSLEPRLVRYQITNQLGSIALELDGSPDADVLSYEEYYPYGSTAYQGAATASGAAKRHRYAGKERDEESGLYHHGARYYCPWLGRFTSADPIGVGDDANLYVYCRNSPLMYSDPGGTDARLTVNQASQTITYSTTVHVYATGEDLDRLRAAGARATTWFSAQSGDVRVNGETWTVRYDVQFEFHDTATSPMPEGINSVVETSDQYEQHLRHPDRPEGELSRNLTLFPDSSLNAFGSATRLIPGFSSGDSVLSIVPGLESPGTTSWVHRPGSSERMPRAIISLHPDAVADEDEAFHGLIHEVGHTLGFDERYDRGGTEHASHQGYENNFMGSLGFSTNLEIADSQRGASARFAIYAANGQDIDNVAVRGFRVDSTRGGAEPEFYRSGRSNATYQDLQGDLPQEHWSSYREDHRPPGFSIERTPNEAGVRGRVPEPWGTILAIVGAVLAAVAIGLGIYFSHHPI